jgi:hypothetical protein
MSIPSSQQQSVTQSCVPVYPTRSRISIPNTIEELARIPLPDSRDRSFSLSRIPVLISPAYKSNLTSSINPNPTVSIIPTNTTTTLTSTSATTFPSSIASQATPTASQVSIAAAASTMASQNATIDSYFMPVSSSSGVRPNPFSGSLRERVDDFLAGFNVYAKIHKWDDSFKCDGLLMFVTGRAKLWYDHVRRLAAEGKGPFAVETTAVDTTPTSPGHGSSGATAESSKSEAKTTVTSGTTSTSPNWSKVEAAMKEYFKPQDEPMLLRYQLQSRHQFPNESVADYALYKQTLIDRIDPNMSQVEKLQYFLFGLSPHLQERVLPLKPTSFEDAVTKAEDFERALNLAQGTLAVNINHVSSMYNDPYLTQAYPMQRSITAYNGLQ